MDYVENHFVLNPVIQEGRCVIVIIVVEASELVAKSIELVILLTKFLEALVYFLLRSLDLLVDVHGVLLFL